VIFGIYSQNFILAMIGFFVFNTARAEYKQVYNTDLVDKFTARDLVRYQFTRMNTNDWMQSAHELLSHGHERSFVVFDMASQLPVGILREDAIHQAKKENALVQPVSSYMDKEIQAISSNESVQNVQALLNQNESGLLLVIEPQTQQILGVIDDMSMGYFIEVQEKR
jgi:predicted transcriptional regulator